MSWLQFWCYFALGIGFIRSSPLSNTEKEAHSPADDAADKNLNFPFSVPDMILTEEQKRFNGGESRQGIRFDRYPNSKWKNNTIPYDISTEFSISERGEIISAIEALNLRSRYLKILPRGTQKDYVNVINGNGCYSFLGRVGGAQDLSLQRNGCIHRDTVQHEFLHAAGFAHMQNRLDRDNYVEILWENIPEVWRSQYEKTDPRFYGLQGDYDYYSVMHYPINAPGTNKPAFRVIENGINTRRIGQGSVLGATDGDIQKLNALYR